MPSFTPVFERTLECAGHVYQFSINRTGPVGWEVREEEDRRLLRSVRYTDWHRVERARTLLGLKFSGLSGKGRVDA
jgi:hypothetical protein